MSTARVVILGGSRCGKTTLADRWAEEHPDLRVLRSDDLRALGWSEASEVAAQWLDLPGPWLIEGVAMVRALRKWLRANPEGRPCDLVFRLTSPYEDLKPGQASMNKAEATVWREVLPELQRRGVRVVEPGTERPRAVTSRPGP